MSQLDINIEKATAASRAIEKKLCTCCLSADELVPLCKQMMDYINAANLLNQIKGALAKNSKLVKLN